MIFTEHATPELFAAMAEAQGEIENAAKNSSNPHYKSKYADLAEIINTIRPVYAKHGLSATQAPHFDGTVCSVSTLVAHKSGGFIVSTAACIPAKFDAQGIGSATTYLRRYSLAAMAGIAQEDDDGNAAMHDRRPEPVRQQAQPPKPVLDTNNPNVVKLKELRSEIVNGASLSGKDVGDTTKWANGLISAAAKSLELSLKPGDLEKIAEGAMEILVNRVLDAAKAELNAEPANA